MDSFGRASRRRQLHVCLEEPVHDRLPLRAIEQTQPYSYRIRKREDESMAKLLPAQTTFSTARQSSHADLDGQRHANGNGCTQAPYLIKATKAGAGRCVGRARRESIDFGPQHTQDEKQTSRHSQGGLVSLNSRTAKKEDGEDGDWERQMSQCAAAGRTRVDGRGSVSGLRDRTADSPRAHNQAWNSRSSGE